MKSINHQDTNKFFPIINKIRRKNLHEEESNLLINNDDLELLQRANIDRDKTPQENNQYIISDAIDKLNIFGAYYERINSPRHLDTAPGLKNLVTKTANNIKKSWQDSTNNLKPYTTFSRNNLASNPRINHNKPNYLCTTPQAATIFKKQPNKSSSGPDNIPPIILKNLSIKIIKRYTIIFNNSLNNYYFPQDWKVAEVISILKKGKLSTNVGGHRPISQTPSVSKIYEAIINYNLTEFCKTKKIIPNEQFGFKYKHSTVHALHKLTSDINKYLHNNNKVGAVLIDLEKAFDSVWLDGLIFKLNRDKFLPELVLLVYNMVHGKAFVTTDSKNKSSLKFIIKEGLQQGTVTSPLLFNIFTADILKLSGINSLNSTSHAIGFADDLIVYTAHNNTLTIQ